MILQKVHCSIVYIKHVTTTFERFKSAVGTMKVTMFVKC